MKLKPRVRFAPSPTGKLHLGGARTALSNFLFAKKNNGKFLVRIEDTDHERSHHEHTQQICDSLLWMGLKWDEDLIYQSSRSILYKKAVDSLIKNKKAYRCFASKEELLADREKTGSYSYSGIWRNSSEEEVNAKLKMGNPFTVRLRNQNTGKIIFKDLIYGEIVISNSEIDDFIIARSDGTPVYNLTNVIDDNDMKITHVIRGEDHLANTSKQILLYRALGLNVPQFAHLPMILGPDKKRLSKRHGATGVQSYRDQGYQPRALLNYLALLGWNPGTDEEIMDLNRLVNLFDLKKVQKKSAVFDLKKLDWISGQHLTLQDNKDILKRVRNITPGWGISKSDPYCIQVIALNKSRSKSLIDLINLCSCFFEEPNFSDKQSLINIWTDETQEILTSFISELKKVKIWELEILEKTLKEYIKNSGLGFSKIMRPVRYFISGVLNGASLFEIIHLLGKDSTIYRLEKVIGIFSDERKSN